MMVERRLAVVSVLLVTACNATGDHARLSVSLGSSAGALALEGVDITRFVLTTICIDGTETTERGDVGADGAFAVEVPRCPQATLRFRGLAASDQPALDGRTDLAIRAPTTDVTIPVRRVGTVSFVNDDDYVASCALRVPNAPDYESRFTLEPGASRQLVLPVAGVSIACAPADTCGGLDACDFDGPLATRRDVAVPFAGSASLSLANLANALVFTIGPPSPVIAGLPFGPFEVMLVDERGVTIVRNDVEVALIPETPVTNGGFTGERLPLTGGLARFTNVRFTTAGPLTFYAQASVDGALLATERRTVQVLAGGVQELRVSGPPRVVAGVAADFVVTAADGFGNQTPLPDDVSLASDDSLTDPTRFVSVGTGVLPFTHYTAGTHTLTARLVAQPAVLGTVRVEVDAAPATVLTLTGLGTLNYLVGQQTSFTVQARDDWGNIDRAYRGTVTLQAAPPAGFTYPGPHTFDVADAGVFVFTPVAFSSLGARTVTAIDDQARTSTALSVNVVPAGVIDHFDVLVSPQAIVAGGSVSVDVVARDAGGALISGYDNVVFMTSTGGCTGSVNVTMGMGSTTCVMTAAGNHAVTIDDTVVTGTSTLVTVSASTAHTVVVFSNVPSPLVAGELFSIAFQVTDVYGNVLDPRVFAYEPAVAPASLVLNVPAGPTFAGTIATYDGLSISGAASGAVVTIDAGVPGGPGSTNTFDVIPGGGCPVVYVTESGTDTDGCDPGSPVGDIAFAVGRVDNGGQVWIAAGDYLNPVQVVSKRVSILGGFTESFGSRDPLANLTVIAPQSGAPVGVDVQGSGADVVLDGVVVLAASPQSAADQRWAIRAASSAKLKVQNCRLQGPVSDLPINGGAIQVGDAADVLVVNNWIHVGDGATGPAAGTRRGVANNALGPRIDVVHNTFLLATIDVSNGPRSEALFVGTDGANATFTKNLVVGDFSTCNPLGGVCVVREATPPPIRSGLYNHVFGLNPAPAVTTYVSGTITYPSLDGPGGGSFAGNVTQHGQSLGELFASPGAAGGDGDPRTVLDNNWHLALDIRNPFDATKPACGLSDPTPDEPCRGLSFDIDQAPRPANASPGADEFGSGAVGS